MLNIQRNNLDKASSPYLQQHKGNPIHWQEWKQEILDYAKREKKLLFVSSGYATCHWCHVMAAEAFSNKEIAAFLNEHFVAIKIDREQRPDIDHYMMSFLVEQQGHGGWPLNIIMTPDGKPFLAFTYLSAYQKQGIPGLLEFLHFAKSIYEKHKESIQPFSLPVREDSFVEEQNLLSSIHSQFDEENGGFGFGAKFPPHNTLLFLLHWYAKTKDAGVKMVLEKTLDIMAQRGLHDHLQGGFYRYCVDQQWTIPHFEKMLYDQALLLWVYAVAYKVFGKKEYKCVVEKLIQCLEETFEEDGLYYSGHDADTDHEEGATYLWTEKELRTMLSEEGYQQFCSLYESTPNFEEKIHLVKNQLKYIPEIEKKLLEARKKRAQPFIDKKIITSWNALVGISFLMASRFDCHNQGFQKAEALFQKLLKKHYENGKLAHSSLASTVQKNAEFLEDYAAMLLFVTYLYEEKPTKEIAIQMKKFLKKVLLFKKSDSLWNENKTTDFVEILAQSYDHPTPSSISLVEFALFRAQFFLEKEYEPVSYQRPLAHDFYNLMVFFKKGKGHLVKTPSLLSWKELPLHSIQVLLKKNQNIQDCYEGTCQEFQTAAQLRTHLKI